MTLVDDPFAIVRPNGKKAPASPVPAAPTPATRTETASPEAALETPAVKARDAATATPQMTPAQRRVFDELLAIGAPRPSAVPDLANRLRARIVEGTKEALERWTEPTMWLSKSQLFTALRCEGQAEADVHKGRRSGLHPATATGIVVHRAVQIAHTHPGRAVADYVEAAVTGALEEDNFSVYWNKASMAVQSDLHSSAVSQVAGFLDCWPTLDKAWTPRFEESIQAKLGSLILAARPDLVLGRPRPERQSMLLVDLKTTNIAEYHEPEAMFYALVSTLRHGVAPWRSTVYSLSSGEWTNPDVTVEQLELAADRVITGVNSLVDVLTDAREANLVAGIHCNWCPLKATCPAQAAYAAEQSGGESVNVALES
jgi:hypothetical protein